MENRELRLGDITIAYRDSGGNGNPVVVLHGLAGSSAEFIATAEALPEYRVLLVDQRGHGQSTRVPADLSREAFVADIVNLIERRVGSPVALVGQSMGAHTAMLVAAARPDLIKRLVLLEVGAVGGNVDANAAIGDYFRSWPAPFADRQAALAFFGDGPLERAWATDLEERPDGLWPRYDPDVLVETMNAVATPRWDEWRSVTAPTLVVYAENGMFSSDQKADFVAGNVNAQRVDLDAASHDAHLDAQQEWIRALRAFLRSPVESGAAG